MEYWGGGSLHQSHLEFSSTELSTLLVRINRVGGTGEGIDGGTAEWIDGGSTELIAGGSTEGINVNGGTTERIGEGIDDSWGCCGS